MVCFKILTLAIFLPASAEDGRAFGGALHWFIFYVTNGAISDHLLISAKDEIKAVEWSESRDETGGAFDGWHHELWRIHPQIPLGA
jgi:hypothetical protein